VLSKLLKEYLVKCFIKIVTDIEKFRLFQRISVAIQLSGILKSFNFFKIDIIPHLF
jgi:hypothetical protein